MQGGKITRAGPVTPLRACRWGYTHIWVRCNAGHAPPCQAASFAPLRETEAEPFPELHLPGCTEVHKAEEHNPIQKVLSNLSSLLTTLCTSLALNSAEAIKVQISAELFLIQLEQFLS